MTYPTEAFNGIECLEKAETLEAMLACPFDAEKLSALLTTVSLQEARELRGRILCVLGKLNNAIADTEGTMHAQRREIARARHHARAGLTYIATAKL